MSRWIRIATRSSPLALWQARYVAQLLHRAHPGIKTTLVPITASGDKNLETPLYGMGNVGVFAKEVHQLILNKDADIGVHSCKDLPTASPDGIEIAAVCKRHDPRDVLVSQKPLSELPKDACIGTSSLRRQYQLSSIRPDLQYKSIRGNVGTRLKKIENGEYDATLMAYAGLKRLNIHRSTPLHILNPINECCPAPAQGAIAIDCLSKRNDLKHILSYINHHITHQAISIEREVLSGLRGGCSLPLGCFVSPVELKWQLHAVLGKENGELKKIHLTGNRNNLARQTLELLQ